MGLQCIRKGEGGAAARSHSAQDLLSVPLCVNCVCLKVVSEGLLGPFEDVDGGQDHMLSRLSLDHGGLSPAADIPTVSDELCPLGESVNNHNFGHCNGVWVVFSFLEVQDKNSLATLIPIKCENKSSLLSSV